MLTLNDYELEERRHRDNILQQRLIRRLTWALIAVGISQTAVTYAANFDSVNKVIKSLIKFMF